MSQDKKYNDPANYRALSEPHESSKIQESIDAFIEECRVSRNKHKLPDVQIIILANIKDEAGNEGPVMSRVHFGDPMKVQMMLARALGSQETVDKEYMSALLSAARRGK